MKKSLNDLYDYGLQIYQLDETFKFSVDSILLAEFVEINNNTKKIVDFCSGNAVIPLILSTKTNVQIEGIEIQPELFEISCESILINELKHRIKIINYDIKNIHHLYGSESIDIVTCNPPYFKSSNTKHKNENYIKAVSRHELLITFKEIAETASFILKNKGTFYCVHRPERLDELIYALKEAKLTVKVVQFIYSNIENDAIMVLIKAVKNGNDGMKILKPLDISKLHTYKNMVGEKQ